MIDLICLIMFLLKIGVRIYVAETKKKGFYNLTRFKIENCNIFLTVTKIED